MGDLICCECSCKIINDSDYVNVNNNVLCRECYNNKYTTCTNCNDIIRIDDAQENDDDYYCQECYENNFSQCYHCNQEYPNDDLRFYRSCPYCEDCFNDTFIACWDCGETITHENAYCSETNDHYYCRDCYPNEDDADGVYSYSYKPEFIYYRGKNEIGNTDKNKNLYYGIELEVENKSNTNIEDVVSNLPEFVYCKNDGSLNNGFEIVSHPCTYQWLRENAHKWLEILNIRKDGFRSYNTDTCGIHIHLSKNYFSSLHLWKFLTLFYIPKNAKFILKVSQRISHRFNAWCALRPDEHTICYKAKNKQGNYERFEAVNLQNAHTMEIRIFRGTLNARSFWKNIEFLQAIIDFTKDTPCNEIDEPHFLTYTYQHKRKYINLHNWLWDKKFYEDSLNE